MKSSRDTAGDSSPEASKPRNGKPVNGKNGTPQSSPQDSTEFTDEAAMEYYILCPQRPTEVPGLITHLISQDICERRQAENYHKCPNCIRSRIWRAANGRPVAARAAK